MLLLDGHSIYQSYSNLDLFPLSTEISRHRKSVLRLLSVFKPNDHPLLLPQKMKKKPLVALRDFEMLKAHSIVTIVSV